LGRVLIAGCGYVGCALGELLARDGLEVYGLRRRAGPLPAGVTPIVADLAMPASLLGLPERIDYAFYLAGPSGREDAFYRTAYVDGLGNLIARFTEMGQRPKRIFFASSTSVFEQDKGEWVDETTPAEPQHYTGRRLLEAEALLLGSDFAGTVVRFAGIYGRRPRWTNRIHRDDCAGALRHLMRLVSAEKLYLGVDCEPAEESALLRWLAGAVGAPPPRADRDAAEAPARGNKRCRNDRLRASGYQFLYPTYREGYTALLATGP
jgi:hypothetical protein